MRPQTQLGTPFTRFMEPQSTIHILSACLSLMIAISLITTRALKPICARVLGVNYLLIFTQHSLAAISFSGVWPQASITRAFVAMLLGPALYLYFSSVLKEERLWEMRKLIHLAPLGLMAYAPFAPFDWIIDFLIVGSFAAYTIAILVQSQLTTSDAIKDYDSTAARRWLQVLLAVMFLNVASEVGIMIEIQSGVRPNESVTLSFTNAFMLGFHLFALTLTLTRSPLIEWMHDLKQRVIPPSKTTQLSESELEQLFKNWQELVEAKALYLNEKGITVSRAARLLGVPSRHLSQAINTVYGASFSQYLNDQRVERATQLLTQSPELSITDTYLTAGFSTKSHFHKEFSRYTGLTPSQYRENKT